MLQIYEKRCSKSVLPTFATPFPVLFYLFLKGREWIFTSGIQHFSNVVDFEECRAATFTEAAAQVSNHVVTGDTSADNQYVQCAL